MTVSTLATTVSGTATLESPLVQSDFRSTSDPQNDGWGLVYAQPINRYFACCNMAGGPAVLELDPTTTPWTLRRNSYPSPTITNPRLMRKAQFYPALNAIVLMDQASTPMLIYKF
jgi:hypothetical protein